MNNPAASIKTTLRIPGAWTHPRELVQRLPAGCRLTPEALILADATQIEFTAMAADDQFAGIFRSSCRQPATAEGGPCPTPSAPSPEPATPSRPWS